MDTLWRNVEKTDGCWLWTGKRNRQGYGEIKIGLQPTEPLRHLRANRLSWMLHFGDIPAGQSVLHHCDNPPCVRPDHLYLGTHKRNMEDAASKGRMQNGERRPLSKLTAGEVIEIRSLLARGMYQKQIADTFGISQALVSYIFLRKTWKHI